MGDIKKPQSDAADVPGDEAGRGTPITNNTSGRVKHDDRGNAIWEWAVTTGALSLESSTKRLKKLDNPTLSLAEDAPMKLGTVKENPLGTVKGYSPYDSGVLAKKEAHPKKDLRKLSEWLKLKQQAIVRKREE